MGARAVLISALIAWASAAAHAQARVELKVSTYETAVDEPIQATLTASDFKTCGQPQLPDSADFAFELLGGGSDQTSSFTVIENGRRKTQESHTRVFQIEVTPNKPGALTIPELSIDVDGQTVTTSPVRIKVREPDKDPLVSATITCDAASLYVGQQALFRLVIEIRAAQAGRQTLSAGSMLGTMDRRGQGFGPFPPIRDERQVTEFTRTLSDGTAAPFYRFTSEWLTVIDRPNSDLFSDVVIACFYPTAFGRNMFGELEVTKQRNLRIKPKVQMPAVRALPKDNQPHGFTGAVGRFNISTTTPNRKVRVGDPIELTIDITGDGPLSTLPPPDLSAQEALRAGFRVPSETLAGTNQGDRRRFTQTIRPTRADVTEIPPIEYPYFDPTTGAYSIARSAAIPLTVSASEQLTAADVDIASPQAGGPAKSVEAIDGLRGNQTDPALLLASAPLITPTQVTIALVAPPALVLSGWGCAAFLRMRQSDPRRRRKQAALATAVRRVSEAEHQPAPERTIESALAGYFADRLGEPPAKFTGAAGVALLHEKNAPAELRTELSQLVEECQRATYAGLSAGAGRELCTRAREFLNRMERQSL